MDKNQFSERWTQITRKRHLTSQDIGFIIQACKQCPTYQTNANKASVSVTSQRVQIARGRWVNMVHLNKQPVSKIKLLNHLYPKKVNRKRTTSDWAYSVRSALRLSIQPQIEAFKDGLKFPLSCRISGQRIIDIGEIDVDHFSKTFLELVESWLISEGKTYNDIKLEGPPTAKRLKDSRLNQSWQEFHKRNADLAAVTRSANRSQGSKGYKKSSSL